MTAQERVEERGHALRHAQSMGNLYGGYLGAGMVAAAMRDQQGPPSLDLLRAQHIALQGAVQKTSPSPSADSARGRSPGGPPSPSRLPAFLQQRQQAAREALHSPASVSPAAAFGSRPTSFNLQLPMARARSSGPALERPKSMLELSQAYKIHEDRPRDDGVHDGNAFRQRVRDRADVLASFQVREPTRLSDRGDEGTSEGPRLGLRRSSGLRKTRSHGFLGRSLGAAIEDPAKLRQQPAHIAKDPSPSTALALPRSSSAAVGPSTLKARGRSLSEGYNLARHSTLLSSNANPIQHARQLSRLLAPTSSAAPRASGSLSKKATSTPASAKIAALEGAKPASKARVDIDVMLESSLVVEGGALRGRMEIKVAPGDKKSGDVWMGEPKIRAVGFEGA